MPYADLFVGILLIILLVIAGYRILSSDSGARELHRDDLGKLIAIGERQRATPGHLSGRGAQTSAPLQLSAGSYRMDYQFETPTRVALIDASSENTLLIKSNSGSEVFTITEAGRYRLRIEPADESASWTLSYRQIS